MAGLLTGGEAGVRGYARAKLDELRTELAEAVVERASRHPLN